MPSHWSFAGRLGRALLAAALVIGCGWVGGGWVGGASAAEPPGPREAVGYATADGTGASQRWTLPEGTPFLPVPEVGPELGAVATVEIGAEVGVALFQKPYFRSKDLGCTPDLGTDARSDLKWLGATARFVPGVPAQTAEQAQRPDPAAGGYTSLIVYDRDLGPPPGALLLDRRRTLGTACPNPIHKIFYNRLFVPIAEAPEAVRCFDLAGLHPGAKGEDILMAFKASDRVALLTPADLDDRYAGRLHRFTVTLFDGIGCSGTPLGLKSGASVSGIFRLDDYGFRDAARSLRIAYEGGVLTPYLAAPAPAPEVASPQPAAQDPALAALESATSQPADQPVEQAPDQPADQRAARPAAMETAATETGRVAPVAPEAETASPPAARPVEAERAAAEPETAEPEAAARPATDQSAAASPAREADARDRTATNPAPAPAPEPAPEPAGASAAGLPKLQPSLEPETQVAAVASQTFAYPVHDIYRLNYCLNWERDCGAPAADAWCRARGFGRAADFAVDENIGALFPTIVLGEKRVCAQFVCDGFAEITCTK